jgi:two-component system, NarL family, nitrate/nitrite response regulator NarL
MIGDTDKNEFMQAMKLGCSGIVLKQTAPDLIVKSIRKVNSGEIWLDSHTTAAVMRHFSTGLEGSGSAQGKGRERSPLSTREREIVALVAQGYKNNVALPVRKARHKGFKTRISAPISTSPRSIVEK